MADTPNSIPTPIPEANAPVAATKPVEIPKVVETPVVKPQVSQVPVTPKLDWVAAETYLKAVKDKVFEYKGKVGYNPFVWWRDNNGAELEEGLLKNKTPDLHRAIMALKFSEPTVTQPGFVPTPDKR